mgnify:CR=1 FL=1
MPQPRNTRAIIPAKLFSIQRTGLLWRILVISFGWRSMRIGKPQAFRVTRGTVQAVERSAFRLLTSTQVLAN